MKKILIVDDEESTRRLVRLTLGEDGYQLEEAEDGQQALAKAREFKPDLVILDLMMPDQWGYRVCEELKQDPATCQARVLILSGRSSHLSQKLGNLKGGDEFMA